MKQLFRRIVAGVRGPACVLSCVAICLGLAGTANAQAWWDSNWGGRKKLAFKNGDQAENLVDFPVLVKLNSGRIDYSKTLNAGEDLRFIDADGVTVLPHEIEQWDESDTSYVWVKVPQVDGSSTTDHIWMYYDNASAPDAQHAEGVWFPDYAGVWHLDESPANGSSGHVNSAAFAGGPAVVVDVNSASADANVIDITGHDVSGSNMLLIVCVALEIIDSDKEVASVTWDQGGNNQALTRFNALNPGHGKLRMEVWYLLNPTDAIGATVRVTLENGNTQKMAAVAMSLSGVSRINPLKDWTTADAIDLEPGPITVPLAESGALVLDFAAKLTPDDPTAGADQTERYDLLLSNDIRFFGSSQDGADGGVMSWTIGGGEKENTHVGFRIGRSPTDATPQNFAGAAGSTTNATGMIGGADELDGVNDYINVPDHYILHMTSQLTLSAWAYSRNQGGANIVGKPNANPQVDPWYDYALLVSNDVDQVQFRGEDANSLSYQGDVPENSWLHVVGTWDKTVDGGELKIYTDGTETIYALLQSKTVDITDGGMDVKFGINQALTGEVFDGFLDEIRISNVARSADWIAAQYKSMTDDFITWGGVSIISWREVVNKP